MGLIISRRHGESVILTISDDVTPAEAWEALRDGLKISLSDSNPKKAYLSVDVPRFVKILREEWVNALS